MLLIWCLFVVSWGFYVGSALMNARDSGREAIEVLGAAGVGTALFFWRWLVKDNASLHGALLGASLFALVILAITRGRPSRMFDPKPLDPNALPLTPDEELARRRAKRAVRIHQAVFIVTVLAFFIVYGLTGATFLD